MKRRARFYVAVDRSVRAARYDGIVVYGVAALFSHLFSFVAR